MVWHNYISCVAKAHRSFDDDNGVSVVLVNTQKGRKLFEVVADVISCVISQTKYLYRLNPMLAKPVELTVRQKERRTSFFAHLANDNFDALVMRLSSRPFWRRALSSGKRCMLWLPRQVEERIFFR